MSEMQNIPPLLRGRSIAIAGAGPAGLTLARLLQMQGAQVSVYERDASQDTRGQGGSLDLHEDSGQLALERAGLSRQFQAFARPEGQYTTIYDKHGVMRADFTADDEAQSRPEIDRRDLRDLLHDSLTAGTVHWGHTLENVEQTGAGRWKLRFLGGDTIEADLLFGCDGGWSKVRPLRSEVRPAYSGVTFVQTWIAEAEARQPDIAALVGQGNMMALGDDKALMAQRNGNGDIRIYVALRVPEDWSRTRPYAWSDTVVARADLLGPFEGWAESIVSLLQKADPVFQPWPLYCFPPKQRWRDAPGVTLLGDAAHMMPPFTGRGANHAMLDAVELAERLASERFANVRAALADYEAAMLARMKPAIEEVLQSQERLIAPDAPEGIVNLLQRNTDSSR